MCDGRPVGIEIMASKAVQHYDKDYFEWQKHLGQFGGVANQIKFRDFIRANEKVLDFGCGGGYLLSSFENIERYGVEINPDASQVATSNGLTCFADSSLLPKSFFDLIISNNALEHTENPLQELRNLYASLKPGGRICMIVPLDIKSYAYKPNDINFHLFSWSPMNLGNLLDCAGFQVIKSEPFIHKWPPKHALLARLLGWSAFHLLCRVYGRIEASWCQVRAVAVKPA